MFFTLLFQTLFLEATPSLSSAYEGYSYAGWDTKKRTFVLDIASAKSVVELSEIIKQITGAEATLAQDQFKVLQDQMSKAVAAADNEDAAKKAVIEVVSASVLPAETKTEKTLKPLETMVETAASTPASSVIPINAVAATNSGSQYTGSVQSFHRPSGFQLSKIALLLQKEGKIKPEPRRTDYPSYDLYEIALKEWSRHVLRAFLHARHPFLVSQIRAKWTMPNKAEIPETAEILEKIIDSENHTSAEHIPYYHGMNSMATFLMVMYDVFFKVFQDRGLTPNFSKLRMNLERCAAEQ